MLPLLLLALPTIHVHNEGELRQALAHPRPGTVVALEPRDYHGGFLFSGVRGVTVRSADPARPTRLIGGVQFSGASDLELRDLELVGPAGNVLNIDDGGTITTPSRHIVLRNLKVNNGLEAGANDIKLAGVDDFEIVGCDIRRWAGCGIDMVGCHRGTIHDCRFDGGGSTGVQAKGGTSRVTVRRCEFVDYGGRGVNLGGNTGRQFFRPPLSSIREGSRYEAKDLTVEGCVFRGGQAPVSFTGVDGAVVRFNTIFLPERWAMRILQETSAKDFVPSRNGRFEDNLLVFRSDQWVEGGVNIGTGTAPATFRFARNLWFCQDRPTRSRPTLPTPEVGGIYGVDPELGGDLRPGPGSPASRVGAHALPK